MRIMELDQNDITRLPTKVVLELLPQADGSVRAIWHDQVFRELMEGNPPGVMGDDGAMVHLATSELWHRYARKLYQRSQVYGVLPILL